MITFDSAHKKGTHKSPPIPFKQNAAMHKHAQNKPFRIFCRRLSRVHSEPLLGTGTVVVKEVFQVSAWRPAAR